MHCRSFSMTYPNYPFPNFGIESKFFITSAWNLNLVSQDMFTAFLLFGKLFTA
jgi:hypothetical protein